MPVDFGDIYRAFTDLGTAGVNVEADLKAVAFTRAQAVKAAAQRRLPSAGDTPQATGTTKRHVVVVNDSAHRQFRVEVEDIPGRNPMIPVYIEFGTVGTAARPFLRPAVDENRSAYFADAEAAVTKRVKAVL